MTSTDTTETRKCLGGCGYTLRSAKAVARGYGSRCWAKVRKAAQDADLSAWTPSQVEESRRAIEDGAVVLSTRKASSTWSAATAARYTSRTATGATASAASRRANRAPAGTAALS
jgi:hypothetical protein